MRFVLICLVATLFSSPALAFEGELKARLGGRPGAALRVHAWYSGAGDVRIDTSGQAPDGRSVRSSTIMPGKGESYYAVSHDQKIIMEVSYATLRASSQQVTASGEDANIEVQKLGKAKVSGVETEHVRVIDKDNDTTVDLWMTAKYPPDLWTRAFRGRNLGLEVSDDERMKAMKKHGIKPGFAMKMQVEQQGGPPVVFLVEEIKKTKVPQQTFALPSGYKRVKRPEMLPPAPPSAAPYPSAPEGAAVP